MVAFTAPCPNGHRDAAWSQTPTGGPVLPEHFRIACGACNLAAGRRLPVTSPNVAAVPAPRPLTLRGYRWAKAVMS
jgi:hypothetical protein